jgi:CheY-like chemotaxis protein
VNAVLATTAAAPTDAGGEAEGARETGGRFVDLLVVDDMENVQKKLRSMLPPHVTLNGFTSAQSALGACRERVYRLILIDTEIPDVDSSVLAKQLRMLQPHAALVALALRTSNDMSKEIADLGFDGVLFKPFRPENVDDFLLHYFDNQDLLQVEDNVIRIAAYQGRADRIERYYGRLGNLLPGAMEKIASACYDELVLDLGAPPLESDLLPKFVNTVATRSKDYGMALSVVGPGEVRKILQGFTETSDLRFCGTVQEARGAGA